jgi:hypothetical protein
MSCIIVDIDGTIALRGERNPYDWFNVINDKPNKPIIKLLMQLEDWNDLIFVSGSKDVCMPQTVMWLKQQGFDLKELYMRDSDDDRPDEIVKKEIYQVHIAHRDVLCVFDDRNKVVSMWRELGLTCLQVADGDF